MILIIRPHPLQVQAVDLLPEIHRMGIAHRDPHKLRVPSFYINRLRNPAADHLRYTHVHGHLIHRPLMDLQLKLLDPSQSLHGYPFPSHHAAVVHILSHTADGIAAHSSLRAVRVEHPHSHIRLRRRADKNQPVSPDAEMPVADQYRRPLRPVHLLLKTVDIHIVIADAMHFCKFHPILLLTCQTINIHP